MEIILAPKYDPKKLMFKIDLIVWKLDNHIREKTMTVIV